MDSDDRPVEVSHGHHSAAEDSISRKHLLGQQLREYSLITWFFERVFWLLHLLSPSRLVRRGRVAHVNSEEFRRDPHGSTARRARRVEAYIIAWLLVEATLLSVSAVGASWPYWIPRTLVVVRILDIFQSSVNLGVFDQLRTEERLIISSAVRTLVLSFLNYIELLICFGILYTTMGEALIGSEGWLDDLYFSVVTQLTIGYGDLRPVGWARFVAMVQGLISVAFTILILGRIVSVLPKLATVMKHSQEE
jgi:hypothetical protein